MEINAAGLALIKSFESCELAPYQDVGGIWTVGYGHTKGVTLNTFINQAKAEEWLLEDINDVEQVLNSCLPDPLNENQFSALVSFCFNVGFGKEGVKSGFLVRRIGGPSTLYRLICEKNYPAAAEQFERWVNVQGALCDGILRRRTAEKNLFLKPV